ncbi:MULTISPECIES: nucleoside/nucleotide kinase family protein [Rhizobium]|uniref:Fructose transport system kinase n=1 Tax=Rhizobium favelukesii TaxID=348824 RepID=W6SA41_9HYPH|nr:MULTISPECIES: nucleoside/nucleotide kinase family protein [Rhizobium]MCS0462539.1 nucleoside/nucleotide kinase family protein [Rhizobium favelukesii]UFS79425.1 nucleoside/nucleotide kinase family protein [Rhizobium sp. T136]CDM62991.1 putative fructose transport system kinase [Rhizobium favelukesii]
MSNIEENSSEIAKIAVQRFAAMCGRRVLIAIAGAPGSGKSTLAERAVQLINGEHHLRAALFPMDGHHYDDVVLEQMGRLAFKGAIDTFDAHGLRHMLKRLKTNDDDVIAVPVFDRSIEIARAGGSLVPQSTEIIVCEGNYLLARQSPWDKLKEIFDFTVFVDVGEDQLRQRLQDRWRGYGLDPKEINRKVEENDLRNGLAIISGSAEPDLRVDNN